MAEDDLFEVDEKVSIPMPIRFAPITPVMSAQLKTSKGDPDENPTTFYGSADEWVRKFLLPTYRRRVTAKGQSGGARWAAAWWTSVEAMLRLESQWRIWEEARQDPAELSAWMINHLDVHMSVLLAADGPFATSIDENRAGETLPYTAPPKGMFLADRQS